MGSPATNRVRFADSSIVHFGVILTRPGDARVTGAGIPWTVRWFDRPKTSPPLPRASDVDFCESAGSSRAVGPYWRPVPSLVARLEELKTCRTGGNLNR